MSSAKKVVWVTGASSGIGAALSCNYAESGAALVLSGRDKKRLDSVAEQCDEALVLPFDIRDESDLQKATKEAFEWKGKIDIGIANAGISQRSQALKTNIEVYREIIEIDLIAQIAFSQGLIGQMVASGSGSLVFISSIAGKVGVPMRTAYSAAKFGLAGYADALRAELSQKNVSIHVVYPGSIATNVSRNALTGDGSKRGRSDKVIDAGLSATSAAVSIVNAVARGEREIIVAEGMELAMGELRRTPNELFDQVANMVAHGYIEKMEEE